MTNLTTSIHPSTTTSVDALAGTSTAVISTDAAFFELVLDLDLDPADAWQRRAIEWARLVSRLRSIGAVIAIGAPS